MSNLAVVVLGRMLTSVDTAEGIAESWKLSSVDRKQLVWTVRNRDEILTDDRVKYLMTVEGVDRDWILDLMRSQERYDAVARLSTWEIPTFPITGNDLLDRGMPAGPKIGQKLKALKEQWAISGYKMTRKELLESV